MKSSKCMVFCNAWDLQAVSQPTIQKFTNQQIKFEQMSAEWYAETSCLPEHIVNAKDQFSFLNPIIHGKYENNNTRMFIYI